MNRRSRPDAIGVLAHLNDINHSPGAAVPFHPATEPAQFSLGIHCRRDAGIGLASSLNAAESSISSAHYNVIVEVADRPGALGAVFRVLDRLGISVIAAFGQHARRANNLAPAAATASFWVLNLAVANLGACGNSRRHLALRC